MDTYLMLYLARVKATDALVDLLNLVGGQVGEPAPTYTVAYATRGAR